MCVFAGFRILKGGFASDPGVPKKRREILLKTPGVNTLRHSLCAPSQTMLNDVAEEQWGAMGNSLYEFCRFTVDLDANWQEAADMEVTSPQSDIIAPWQAQCQPDVICVALLCPVACAGSYGLGHFAAVAGRTAS